MRACCRASRRWSSSRALAIGAFRWAQWGLHFICDSWLCFRGFFGNWFLRLRPPQQNLVLLVFVFSRFCLGVVSALILLLTRRGAQAKQAIVMACVTRFHWAHGVVVSHPLRMRKALGSIPSVSTFAELPSATMFEMCARSVNLGHMFTSSARVHPCVRPSVGAVFLNRPCPGPLPGQASPTVLASRKKGTPGIGPGTR